MALWNIFVENYRFVPQNYDLFSERANKKQLFLKKCNFFVTNCV